MKAFRQSLEVWDRLVKEAPHDTQLLESKGLPNVAAEGFQAPGVVVCHTEDVGVHNGSKFAGAGLQIAAGVPLRCDEPEGFRTFRIGLFGLDKLHNIDRTVGSLDRALSEIL